jgi:hypothetical protein
MVHDQDPIEGAGGLGEAAGTAAAAGAAAACLSCGASIAGPFCYSCGQKNDDLRRSSLVLFRDFMRDTFGFDSRMWRTLGLMAVAPGVVPASYAHGRRSRFTPPIRLFLVVSFLFFLELSLTRTMFVAVEVTRKTAEEVAADAAAMEAARLEDPEAFESEELAEIEGRALACPINIRTRFFVRPDDVKVDLDAWRACAQSLRDAARAETGRETQAEAKAAISAFERAATGISSVVEDPRRLNKDINDWLPRVMFLMTPLLALLIALFIRGRDALLFDNLVLSIYTHAAAFAIAGAGILAARLGVPHAGAGAAFALAIYFTLAVRRAYRRSWIKTLFATFFIASLYLAILSSIVTSIVGRSIWEGA